MAGDLLQFPSRKKDLRPHQAKAIDDLRRSLGSGKRRPMLQAPTGAGKTVIAANLINLAREKGNSVTFTVPHLSLIDQTIDAFRAEGIFDIGVVQSDHPMTDPSQPVQIASVQTLAVRKAYPKTDFVIVDEAHKRSKAIDDWMAMDPKMPFVGLSATPWARGLGKQFDDLIVAATIKSLIADGYLSDFRAFAPAHPDLTGIKIANGDYHQGQLGDAMANDGLVADVVSTWFRLGEMRPTLVFAVNRLHAQALQKQFEGAGVNAGYVDANTDRVERELIRRRFQSGDLRVVVNIGCLTTGVDWAVGCIVLARPTRSEMLYVQMIGRGLRVNEGLDDCIILDHADNTLRMGFVTDIHYPALDTGERTDVARGRAEPLPKECPQCTFLKPPKARVCPSCGHEAQKPPCDVEARDGEIVAVKGKARKASREEKQAFYSGLLGYCHQKGKKKGFAYHTYRERFGVAPQGLSEFPCAPSGEVLAYIQAKNIRFAKGMEKRRAS